MAKSSYSYQKHLKEVEKQKKKEQKRQKKLANKLEKDENTSETVLPEEEPKSI
jgi:hypothetical protein